MHIVCAVCEDRLRDSDESSWVFRSACGHLICRSCLESLDNANGHQQVLVCEDCSAAISKQDCRRIYLNPWLVADASDNEINGAIDRDANVSMTLKGIVASRHRLQLCESKHQLVKQELDDNVELSTALQSQLANLVQTRLAIATRLLSLSTKRDGLRAERVELQERQHGTAPG
ncbi:uncharacterized protein B0H18DRAFT_1123037 [Fomitopsis serialis]|uniref:uncharacterized protein n=1 Tax=Fomitopsis serialis TaxID=139415 RepID=UPI0020081E58|nr:uncharacterized protein B0H18DRAFT_1123786 [Neoantrodia serialis]XP_047888923.1 uncharacterized protein B0H18DRAFT_1123037 [Neoantrodia serialis]KAH9917193.1 hypothetical protein B0H18DRAFT_1123786 [Neoantrodia serialis]KAH9918432.1 hypothetical protein B0H18DRAFT_1123037 [Neoantrodia serialis]